MHEAFNDQAANNKTVTLKQQIPIVIFYLTANVNEDGTTHFFDDIYGYDKQLDDVLAKGMPYPSQQGKGESERGEHAGRHGLATELLNY